MMEHDANDPGRFIRRTRGFGSVTTSMFLPIGLDLSSLLCRVVSAVPITESVWSDLYRLFGY
jgi:hypothetical protein